ncbi:MAG: hypothetical protein K9K79_08285, partial [Desulfohalobiaceae bacterium]|nr:hypothetical protein [Desulfohalobiaceae bacterium]
MAANESQSETYQWKNMEWLVFLLSGGVLLLFVIASLIDVEYVSGVVNSSFAWSCKYFGAYWQWLVFLN